MKEEAYIIVEKENREIIVFDVLEWEITKEDRNALHRYDSMELKVKLFSDKGLEILNLWEAPDKYNKYDILFIYFGNSIGIERYLQSCSIIGFEFLYDTSEISFSIDYETNIRNSNEARHGSLSIIKSYKRDQKLRSIGI
jgi:hypothetical protein